jgi:hypothetical protein
MPPILPALRVATLVGCDETPKFYSKGTFTLQITASKAGHMQQLSFELNVYRYSREETHTYHLLLLFLVTTKHNSSHVDSALTQLAPTPFLTH